MTVWADVEADHQQFFLAAVDMDPSTVPGAGDLLDASSNVVVIRTGIATGPVSVALSVLDGEPAASATRWEDVDHAVVEVTRPLMVMTTLGDVSEIHGTVAPSTTGWVSVRVSANGRGAQSGAIVDASSEQYLLEVWPADAPAGATDDARTASRRQAADRGNERFATDATARRRGPVAWNPEA